MSYLDNNVNSFFSEGLKADMERMRIQKIKLENLLKRIEKEKQVLLREIKAN